MEWCADAGSLGAMCITSISGKEREIAKAEWDKARFGWLCTSPESFAEIKKVILKFCESNKKRCELEAVKKVEDVDSKMQQVSQKAKRTWD